MFINEDIIEFINRIINSSQDNGEIKNNIKKFADYLELTKMADTKTLDQISLILSCLDSILTIKKAVGKVDIATILNQEEIRDEREKEYTKKREIERIYEEKHYHHYYNDSSSNCGGGPSSSTSRC